MTRGGRPAPMATALAALRTDLGGAALLLAATIVALIWANLPIAFGYSEFWSIDVTVGIGGADLHVSLHELVNQGLMTIFFFVVGLEVKRDLVLGELADRRRIAVPLMAAAVGMVVPAGIYLAITWGTAEQNGWGTVISTDTAFLLGVLALLGRACPPQLRVLLMALAVADDVGALSVIAVVYTSDLNLGYLVAAVAGIGLMFVLRWLKVWRGPAYLVIGIASWIALYLSGVEPTLLGVAVAFATETYPTRRDHVAAASRRTRAYLQYPSAEMARSAQLSLQRAVPVNERLLRLWQPWSTVVIVPLFALANAGIPLSLNQIEQAFSAPVTLGIVAGLVVGKGLGIFVGAELAVRLRLGQLAPGITRLHLFGGAVLAGMGFTISLFIVNLAFASAEAADAARIGILAASLLAALLGAMLLKYASHRHPAQPTPEHLEPPVDVKRDHVRGPVDAPLTLVEYGDYESPESYGAHRAVQEVQRRRPDQVRFVFRHLVDAGSGPNSQLAAEAAEVADAQGRFWEMHDELFAPPSDATDDHLGIVDLLDKAAAVDLDQATFASDLGAAQCARRVHKDTVSAHASGVTQSPTFFVNGTRYRGPHDADSLIAALDAAMLETVGGDDGVGTTPAPRSDVLPPWRANSPRQSMAADALSPDLAETPDHGAVLPRLHSSDLELLKVEGAVENTTEGQILFDVGDGVDDLLVILSGAVAIVEYARHIAPEVSVHERGRFLGEVDLLTHQVSSRTAVVIRAGQIARLSPRQQQVVFRRHARLRETITRTVLLRRAGLLDVPDIRVVGMPDADATRTLAEWADAHALTMGLEDVTSLAEHNDLDVLGVAPDDLPLVVTRAGEVLKNPRPEELARVFPDGRTAENRPRPS